MMEPELVKEYARKGLTPNQIADLYGCTKSNITHLLSTKDDLKAAWNEGHAELLVELIGQLKKRAMESDVCLLFFLKCVFGFCEEQYKVGKQLEKIEMPRVTIFLPDNGRDNVPEELDQIASD